MPRRGYEPKPQQEFSRACYEWAVEMMRQRGYAAQVTMTHTTRPGVWRVEVRALHVVDGRAAGIAANYRTEWPNGDGREYWAELHVALLRLDAILARDFLTADAVDVS